MSRVWIGRIGRVHGLRGEVSLEGASLDAEALRAVRDFTWHGPDGAERALVLAAARPAHARVLARFEGVDDRDRAQALARGELYAEQAALPDSGPGEAYTFELIGLEVRTEDGRVLGVLREIMNSGAHPIYVVRGERELLLPAHPAFLRRVDLAARTITMAVPAGLEELA